MSPKSKHKSKKATAQRRVQSPAPARSSVSGAGPQATPTMSTAPAARSIGTKAAAVPITTSLNVGREMRTIGIIAGMLFIALIVLAIYLS
jgi:hypothetical protein